MPVRITTLVENSGGEHLALKHEHGLSFYIEKDNHSILFDTGQSQNFILNAEQLQLDMGALSHVVVSHGHYDHSGGLRSLIQVHSGFKLTLGQGFFDEKYAFYNGSYEFLGNNFDEAYLQDQSISYAFVESQVTEILDGVWVVTGFSRTHQDELISSRFLLRKNGRFEPDLFNDEVLVAVDSPEGIIVLLGCSHPGMKNMIDTVRHLFQRPVYAVLGGTHLVEASRESLEKSISYLADESFKVLGVSHCTGAKAMEILGASNRRYFHNRTGSILYVE
jgi:7,8-dihydropterin-6-yl-methyl-4-(beta-D-ribofuranosyl)aminobenzene 5'-phosphate synthase